MRIACLQFSPQLGSLQSNILRAEALLSSSLNSHNLHNLDFLILPELAFTGYNFPSFAAISAYLEPTAAGPSTEWARKTAARLGCIVIVGYPELDSSSSSSASSTIESSSASPTSPFLTSSAASKPICYNSLIIISPKGDVLAHYRKTHLYYTDETWAQPSPSGFLTTSLPLPSSPSSSSSSSSTNSILTSFGICMDLNPHKFTAPWSAYELSTHALNSSASLLICSMAWLSLPPPPSSAEEEKEEREERNDDDDETAEAAVPDKETLGYWVSRLEPLVVQGEREVLVVMVNRCGVEEPNVRYVGTSWVGRVGRGKAEIWGLMGKGEEGVLVVDTEDKPRWAMRMRDKKDEGGG